MNAHVGQIEPSKSPFGVYIWTGERWRLFNVGPMRFAAKSRARFAALAEVPAVIRGYP